MAVVLAAWCNGTPCVYEGSNWPFLILHCRLQALCPFHQLFMAFSDGLRPLLWDGLSPAACRLALKALQRASTSRARGRLAREAV